MNDKKMNWTLLTTEASGDDCKVRMPLQQQRKSINWGRLTQSPDEQRSSLSIDRAEKVDTADQTKQIDWQQLQRLDDIDGEY